MHGTLQAANRGGSSAGAVVAPAATRVLVVDECPKFQTTVAAGLRGHGYVVTAAATGDEALADLPAADVVLFDLDLTGFDGTRLLAALSRDAQDGRRPGRRVVVALTANADPTVHARLRALGVQQVLLKPPADAAAACRAVAAAAPPTRRPAAA